MTEMERVKNDKIKKIMDILLSIDNLWVLNLIYNCAVNVTREDK